MKKGKGKKVKEEKGIEIEMMMPSKPPKPKINEKKVKAMEELLKDPGCRYMSTSEMQGIVDAFKAGKRSKK